MDAILYSLGTTGDALPFFRLAAQLSKKGWRTTNLGSEKFEALADANKLPFTSVSSISAYNSTYNSPLTWSSAYSQNHYNEYHFPAIKPTFLAIKQAVTEGRKPLIIYQDPLSGAKMAADTFDLPSCQISLAPYSMYSELSPAYPLRYQVSEELWSSVIPSIREKSVNDCFDRLVKPLINPARKDLGLTSWDKQDIPSTETSKALLALFPDWFKQNPGDWPIHIKFAGFCLGSNSNGTPDPEVLSFIKNFGQPMVFTFGTGVPVTPNLLDKLLSICGQVGLPGICIAHCLSRGIHRGSNSNLLVLPQHPFHSLFPRAKLIVHHGGIGTCAEALRAGIPQLITPYAFDQPDNAYSVWTLGVGNSIDIFSASPKEVAKMIKEIINEPGIFEKAREYARMTKDSSAEAADFLASLC